MHFEPVSTNCQTAVRMDFVGEQSKACITLLMFSSGVLGHLLLPLSNTVLVSINFSCHARTEGHDGGCLPYFSCSFDESAYPVLSQ